MMHSRSPLRSLLAAVVLLALVPTWLSASSCMVCPHMSSHEGGEDHAHHHGSEVATAGVDTSDAHPRAHHDGPVHDGPAATHGGATMPEGTSLPEGAADPEPPAPDLSNCPCDTFCSVAPVSLDGSAFSAIAEEPGPVQDVVRPDARRLAPREHPPFFLPLPTAPPRTAQH